MSSIAFGISDVGRCRESNEDSFFYDADLGLYAVADGMGGHAAGEVASRLAVDALVEVFNRNGGSRREAAQIAATLCDAASEANRRIFESMHANSERRGMGTTMVTLVTAGSIAIIGHVGDSRAYLLRDDFLRRLTSDHSWVYEQVRAGLLTDDDAQKHPMRNIVTRALGSGPEVKLEVTEQEIRPGDVFLLCSDGLNAMLDDDEIRATLLEYRDDPETACHALVDAANGRGGEDNTTVIVLAPTPTRLASAEPSPLSGRNPTA